MKCPYCGEEILAIARKCKHCGEWLDEEESVDEADEEYDEYDEADQEYDDTDEEYDDTHGRFRVFKRIMKPIVFFLAAFLLFEFGSWNIVWGKKLTDGERFLIHIAAQKAPLDVMTTDSQSFIATKDMLLLRIDKKFYGTIKDTKYFDSPVLQWVMLFSCLSLTVSGIFSIFDDD